MQILKNPVLIMALVYFLRTLTQLRIAQITKEDNEFRAARVFLITSLITLATGLLLLMSQTPLMLAVALGIDILIILNTRELNRDDKVWVRVLTDGVRVCGKLACIVPLLVSLPASTWWWVPAIMAYFSYYPQLTRVREYYVSTHENRQGKLYVQLTSIVLNVGMTLLLGHIITS